MARKKELTDADPFHYALDGHDAAALPALRAETWRAMEDALAEARARARARDARARPRARPLLVSRARFPRSSSVRSQGQTRAIGVSNFTVAHLEALRRTARVWPPAVNQVECHPYHAQRELREYCAREGIVLQAYSCALGGQDAGRGTLAPLGGPLLEHPAVAAAAGGGQGGGRRRRPRGEARRAPTAAQVLLRWALQRGIAVLPKSRSEARARENLAAMNAPHIDQAARRHRSADAGSSGRLAESARRTRCACSEPRARARPRLWLSASSTCIEPARRRLPQ